MPDTSIELLPAANPNGPTQLADGTPPWDALTAEVMDDWQWYAEEFNRGAFVEFVGEYVAIVGRRVVDHGPDPNEMTRRVAAALGVPTSRVVWPFVEDFGVGRIVG